MVNGMLGYSRVYPAMYSYIRGRIGMLAIVLLIMSRMTKLVKGLGLGVLTD